MHSGAGRASLDWSAYLLHPALEESTTGMPRARRVGLFGFARAVAGALVALLVVNIVVACAVFRSPGRRIDPDFGGVQKPGLFVRGTEGFCVTHISSTGLRTVEPEVARSYPERIVFTGDSFTEAEQVMDQDTFVLLVQARLRSQGRKVVCVNAGISGANAASHLYLADAIKLNYAPTRTVLQLEDADFGPELLDPGSSYWLSRADSTWIPRRADPTKGRTWLQDTLTKVPAAYWLFQRWKRVQKLAQSEGDPGVRGADGSAMQQKPDARVVDWVVREARAEYGPNLVILYAAHFDYSSDLTAGSYTEALVREMCVRHDVTYIDLRRPFAERYARTRQPLHGFSNTQPGLGHWNAIGHQVIAEQLLAVLGTAPRPADRDTRGGW
jgi:hypothetical protein